MKLSFHLATYFVEKIRGMRIKSIPIFMLILTYFMKLQCLPYLHSPVSVYNLNLCADSAEAFVILKEM